MKNRRIKYAVIFFLIILGYGSFLFYEDYTEKKNEKPEIQVPDTVLTVSVHDEDAVLLKDVIATDKEDGDLTGDVFIEDISVFDENQERTVTYTVVDKNNAISRAFRNIRYTDYQKPEIYIKRPLILNYWEPADKPKIYVGADSSIDGDISDSISVDSFIEEDDIFAIKYSITDTAGVKTSIVLTATILNNRPNIDITLSTYLLKVAPGTQIEPRQYIEQVKENGIENHDDFSAITIRDNYNPNEKGTYEFLYDLTRVNGNFGFTKLVVVVE